MKRGGALKPVSAKRKGLTAARSEARRTVIERDGGCCAGYGMPGVPHSHSLAIVPEGQREVHELCGGSRRAETFTDTEWLVLTCSALNSWISNGSPREAERRGLRLPSWAGTEERAEAAMLREQWRNGSEPFPSWWVDGQ